jgi:transposase-like protein
MRTRNYDREFKINSIKLYRESQKSMTEICKDLGIPISTFNGWLKEFENFGEGSFPGSGKVKPCNEEVYRLKKQLADVTMERDILKKAIAIFSRPKVTK